jgi:protoporphyrinogen/coproporphyrinogen III oxidase
MDGMDGMDDMDEVDERGARRVKVRSSVVDPRSAIRNRQSKRVGIIGAGISGLAAAYYLKREALLSGQPLHLTVLEASSRLGGVIRSEQSGPFLLEWGPENFVAFKPAALELIRTLGMADQVIGSNDSVRQTYVVQGDRIVPLPDGMAFLSPVNFRSFWASPLISTAGKLRALLEPLIARSKGDLTARRFLQRRLGRELTEKVAEPLVSAIYGGDVDQLSAASAIPDTYQMEQKFGSLWRGSRQGRSRNHGGRPALPFFLSLAGGMSTLVDRLELELQGSTVHRGVRDLALHPDRGGYRVTGKGLELFLDAVLICMPAHAAARTLESLVPDTAAALREIQYTSTSITYLAYQRSEFSHPLDGFGFVTPARDSQVLDACTWVSTKFAGRCPPDAVLLRCAMHDGRRSRPADSDEEIAERAHREVQRLLGIRCEPVLARVSHAVKSMPQLTVGHAERTRKLRAGLKKHPGLFVTGAFFNGIGIPDCVRSAKQTAQEILDVSSH